MRWFPVVGYAIRTLDSLRTQISLTDGMVYRADAANAYVAMLKMVKEKFPQEDGYANHDAVVLDYPQFTITREAE